jgi:hypothetical protein
MLSLVMHPWNTVWPPITQKKNGKFTYIPSKISNIEVETEAKHITCPPKEHQKQRVFEVFMTYTLPPVRLPSPFCRLTSL